MHRPEEQQQVTHEDERVRIRVVPRDAVERVAVDPVQRREVQITVVPREETRHPGGEH